jgi:HEAT repeat protein
MLRDLLLSTARSMTNTCRAAIRVVLPILLVVLWASAATAQIDSYKAVERYNRVSKGANVEEWHKRLFDPNPKTRLEAVDSLAKDGSEETVKPLLDATADSDPRVRAKAIDALGEIGSPKATQVLCQYLVLNDIDRASKQRVLVALGRIGDPTAVEPLISYLQKTKDPELRCGALYALGEIGDARALEPVQAFVSAPDPNVKRLATEALVKIKAKVAALPNAQPTILELEKRMGPQKKEQ